MEDRRPPLVDVTEIARAPGGAARVSTMAGHLVGSEILKIAGEIRAMKASGAAVSDLTVGDFQPRQFPIPELLLGAIEAALRAGETNYPPASGVVPLREAVQRFYERELGLRYPVESVLIAGGARPLIYGTYRALADRGDKIVYPVPSWNNNHYVTMVEGTDAVVVCGPESRFLPSAEALAAELPGARLVCLNSPLNPTGTAITAEALTGICDAILEENRGREARGERPLYLMYDHIYWMLCFGDARHVTPMSLRPEMARYTVMIDGISKAFAATGLRVGWAVGPVDVMSRMNAIIGHVGAWAPRAEQVATTALLDDPAAIRAYHRTFIGAVGERLSMLHHGFQALRDAGLPVDSIPPMGAIYLTARVHPFGKKTPEGATLATNEDVRRYLLDAAGIGIVPFQAFGYPGDDGWFRLSVGAIGIDEIQAALPRLKAALEALV
ncbi:MAG: aminotransferase class I/II-fold pyridoxal phosphate-dependent enzyme [Nannocystaceae bacterium]